MQYATLMIARAGILVVLVGLMVLARPAEAQQQDFEARAWNGGSLASSFRAGANVSGAGVSRATLGAVHVSNGPFDAASVFGNPAALSFVEVPQAAVDFRLPLANGTYGIGPSSLLPRSRIAAETDALLNDLSFDRGTAPVYTEPTSVRAGQPGQLSSFAISRPFGRNAVLAVGVRQPVRVESGVSLSGNQIRLTGLQARGAESTRIDLEAVLAVQAAMDLSIREYTFGAGGLLDTYAFGPVWWGGSIFRSQASMDLSGSLQPQASMMVGGAAPRYFNDAADPGVDGSAQQSNDFFWNMRGAYRGGGWGGRFGLLYRSYSERWGMTLVGTLAPRLDMDDPTAAAEGFLPVFVDMKGELNDDQAPELLDVDRVDTAFPTASVRTRDAMGTALRVRLPSSVTVGVDRSLGRSRLSLNVTRYYGDLSLAGQYGIRNGLLQPYNIGKRMAWGWKGALDLARPRSWVLSVPLRILTLDVDGLLLERFGRLAYAEPRYRFSGGVVSGRVLTDGIDNSFADDLDRWFGGVVPMSLNVARTYSLLETVHIGVTVYSVPDLLFRFSVAIGTYRL